MKISTKGRDLVAEFEQGPGGGPALKAYRCPAGKWTIGYGHTEGVKEGARLESRTHALSILNADLMKFAREVEPLLEKASTSQHEFDAMVSLAFNIGVAGFAKSSVLRQHKAADKVAAARAFGLWNKATVDGKLVELPGLTRRRAAEAALYLTPDAPVTEPMPQAVEPPAGAASNKTVKTVAGAVAAPAAVIVVENAKPAIEAVQGAADAIGQAHSAWGSIKEALSLFANGHFLTALLMAVILVAAGYILFRIWRRIRDGEVKA